MEKLFVITGEASGDLHAAHFIERYKDVNSQLQVMAMGGEHLANAGAKLIYNYSEIAIMGFSEAISKAKYLRNKINQVVESIVSSSPDLLLLVDSSGFNLRVAKKVKERCDIPIHYYIAPKYWAWGKWRVKKFNKCIDKLYCIFPFEVEFFKQNDFNEVEFVGNPTLEELKKYNFNPVKELQGISKPILALLPGSRRQEIQRHLPLMLDVVQSLQADYHAVVAVAPGSKKEYYQSLEDYKNITVIRDATWEILKAAEKAVVCSGTATLEAALIGCPQVVMYRMGRLNYILGKMLVKIKYISLVNILLNKPVVKELIQSQANKDQVLKAMSLLSRVKAREIKEKLGSILNVN